MSLPFNLMFSIETLLENVSSKKIQKAAHELSLRYREKQSKGIKFIQNEDEALAYLCMRLPATYAATAHVFSHLKTLLPSLEVKSILDLGSGSGAAFWSAITTFPEIKKAFLVEEDSYLIDLGKEIACYENKKDEAEWMKHDFTKEKDYPLSDLVVFSYSLGEVSKNYYSEIFSSVIPAFKEFLIVVEPGTPVGFERILHARDHLLNQGLYLVAPCPHSKKCPLMTSFNWCHFSQRLSRSSLHKFLKEGSLGYEDEKFSYVVFSKKDHNLVYDRVIGNPKVNPGYIDLHLCTKEGSSCSKKILKREVENFTQLKKTEWGDAILI